MRWIVAVLGALSIVGLAACGGDAKSDSPDAAGGDGAKKPVVFGAAVATSGFMTAYDEGPTNGLKLAVKELEQQGGMGGRRTGSSSPSRSSSSRAEWAAGR